MRPSSKDGSASEPRATRCNERTGGTTSRRSSERSNSTRPAAPGSRAAPRPPFSMIKDLPEPLVNTNLNGHEADFHWPARKLVVEVDGPGHDRPRTQREDA